MFVKIHKILLILAFLFLLINTQNSVCYSNCKQGYCSDDRPSACTKCDKGQAILNNKCISSNTQPYPLKYLTFDSNNSIAGVVSQSNTFSCSVYKSINGNFTLIKLSSLLYMIVLGSTFTKQFYITESHSYIHLKFNAAVVQSSPVILQYKLLAADGTTLLSNRQAPFTSNDTNLSMQCMNNTTVTGVYFVSQSLSTKKQNLTLQVSSLDGNAMFGVSNFQIFYGSCNRICKTCSGPTETQCLSCQGLYMQLVNGLCQTCPTGYYDDEVLCLLCPQNCNSCTFNNQTQQVTCISCLPWSQLTQGNCTTSYEVFSFSNQLIYNSSYGWISSQTLIEPFSRCGQYSLIGGIPYGIQSSIISKTFTGLEVHSQVDIRMVFWMIDQQPDDTNMYQILVDGVVVSKKQISISSTKQDWMLTDECGNTNPQLQFIVNLTSIPHSVQNITVAITSIKNYFGFRDFILVINNQTNVIGCQSQLNGTCISCRKGFHYNATRKSCNQCSDNYYLTQTNNSCEICPIECQKCQLQSGTDKIECLSCVSPLELVNGYCKDPIGAVYTREIIPHQIQSLTSNSWTMYPKLPNHGITLCDNKSILGSNQIRYKFLKMTRQFNNLPSHKGAKVYLHFYQIDTYSNNSVFFVLNGKQYSYTPTIQRKQICGDPNVPDAVIKLEFTDQNHTDESLLFQIHATEKVKLGVNNIILFLLNCDGCNNVVSFKFESIPVYSLSTPPVKGIKVKLMFDQEIINSTAFNHAIQFSIIDSKQNLSRLLQNLISDHDSLQIAWDQIVENRQYRTFLQLSQDYKGNEILVDPVDFWTLSTDPNQNDPPKLLSSSTVTKNMPRYIDIDENHVYDRTNIRNFRNLFSGCAIFAMWMGLVSFIFGFSCAFDDFFILVQVIFAHIFIQLTYSPPSLRLPLQGMQIVQFVAWLPWQVRVGIEKGIIANDLYQRSPIVYEQYYKDIVYVRTIYHTLLFFAFMGVLYILLLVIAHILKSSSKSKKKYADNYIAKYYSDYEANKFSYIDKFVRFSYFTVIWACTLQFTAFQNTPTSFNIWNSILCISMFVIFIVYPIIGFLWLRKMSGEMSESTFRKKYADIRIDSNRMFHFIWRYYKLFLIALLIGLLYNSNPLGVLIPLIIVHVLDGLIIIFVRPFGMEQEQQLNVCLYNYYPKVYQITSAIQSFIFAFLQLFIIILYALRDTVTNYTYLGLGYFCCVIIVALLINGLLRLVWGFIKIVEECFAKSKEMKLLVQNKAFKEKQSNQELIPMKSVKQLQSNLNNLQSKGRFNTIRKTTLVSKIN